MPPTLPRSFTTLGDSRTTRYSNGSTPPATRSLRSNSCSSMPAPMSISKTFPSRAPSPTATSIPPETAPRSGRYFVSPYLRHDFGSDVQAEARYTYSVVNSDDTVGDSRTAWRTASICGWQAALRTSCSPGTLTIARRTSTTKVGRTPPPSVILASARRLITPTVGLLAQVGYENYEYQRASDLRQRGCRWSAGFDWAPSPRTHLAATAGERFFGNTYFLDFSHRTRLTTWSAGYSENVTTTRTEFFIPAADEHGRLSGHIVLVTIPRSGGPAEGGGGVHRPDGASAEPERSDQLLQSTSCSSQKRWNASAGILGVRNVLIANVFKADPRRVGWQPGSAPETSPSNTIIQTGTSLLWNWRMTAQNAWNLGAAYSRNEYSRTSGEIDYLTYVAMGLTRQFQPRLSGSLSYRRQQNDSNFSAVRLHGKCGVRDTSNEVLTLHVRSFLPFPGQAVSAEPRSPLSFLQQGPPPRHGLPGVRRASGRRVHRHHRERSAPARPCSRAPSPAS